MSDEGKEYQIMPCVPCYERGKDENQIHKLLEEYEKSQRLICLQCSNKVTYTKRSEIERMNKFFKNYI